MSSLSAYPRFKQGIATLLSLCLIWTSGNFAQAAQPAARPIQFELAPPLSLGTVVDFYVGKGAREQGSIGGTSPHAPLVILIQDLHAHYGVQKNISGILDFLTHKLSSPAVASGGSMDPGSPQTGRPGPPDVWRAGLRPAGMTATNLPFALAVEGAQGPVDSSLLALFPDMAVKQEAADYLMREGELSGAEYFAVMRSLPNALVGAEDLRYYNIHRDLFRKTIADREALVAELKRMQSDINLLRRRTYSKPVRAIQSHIDAYQNSEIAIGEYVRLLAAIAARYELPLAAGYPTIGRYIRDPRSIDSSQAALLTHEATELAFRLKAAEAESSAEKDLIHVEHDLALLLRVTDLQATEQEVRDFAPRLNQFVALAVSLVAEGQGGGGAREQAEHISETKLRQLISSSIDYYVIALMRNKPMVDNTLALLSSDVRRPPSDIGPRTAVLVAGGFHTAPITQLLRAKNVSYLVITPAVDQVSDADHELYVKRLGGHLLTDEEVLAQASDRHSPLARLVRKDTAYSLAKLWRADDKSLAIGIGIAGATVTLATLYATGAIHGHLSLTAYLPHFRQLLGQYNNGPAQQAVQGWLPHVVAAGAGAGPALNGAGKWIPRSGDLDSEHKKLLDSHAELSIGPDGISPAVARPRSILGDITDVGPDKPVRYHTLWHLKQMDENPAEVRQKAIRKHLHVALLNIGDFPEWFMKVVGFLGLTGTNFYLKNMGLYVYDTTALSKLLEENRAILQQYSIPLDPDGFIRLLVKIDLPEDHPANPVIGRAFGVHYPGARVPAPRGDESGGPAGGARAVSDLSDTPAPILSSLDLKPTITERLMDRFKASFVYAHQQYILLVLLGFAVAAVLSLFIGWYSLIVTALVVAAVGGFGHRMSKTQGQANRDRRAMMSYLSNPGQIHSIGSVLDHIGKNFGKSANRAAADAFTFVTERAEFYSVPLSLRELCSLMAVYLESPQSDSINATLESMAGRSASPTLPRSSSKRDYYEVLGVKRSISQDNLRTTYRKLVKQYHTDIHPDNPAVAEKFQAINDAYEVLSDPKKRKIYDKLGHGGIKFDEIVQREQRTREVADQDASSPAQPAGAEPMPPNSVLSEFVSDVERNKLDAADPIPTRFIFDLGGRTPNNVGEAARLISDMVAASKTGNQISAPAEAFVLPNKEILFKATIRPRPAGGAMHSPGKQGDPTNEAEMAGLRGRESEFEALVAAQRVNRIKVDETSNYQNVWGYVVTAELGAESGGYQFKSSKYGGDHIVVLNSRLPESHKEALAHELHEIHWMGRGYTQPQAHRIAVALQIKEFSKAGGLTPYHAAWLMNAPPESLQAILDEYESGRDEIVSFVRKVNFDRNLRLNMDMIRTYEKAFYDRARVVLAARRILMALPPNVTPDQLRNYVDAAHRTLNALDSATVHYVVNGAPLPKRAFAQPIAFALGVSRDRIVEKGLDPSAVEAIIEENAPSQLRAGGFTPDSKDSAKTIGRLDQQTWDLLEPAKDVARTLLELHPEQFTGHQPPISISNDPEAYAWVLVKAHFKRLLVAPGSIVKWWQPAYWNTEVFEKNGIGNPYAEPYRSIISHLVNILNEAKGPARPDEVVKSADVKQIIDEVIGVINSEQTLRAYQQAQARGENVSYEIAKLVVYNTLYAFRRQNRFTLNGATRNVTDFDFWIGQLKAAGVDPASDSRIQTLLHAIRTKYAQVSRRPDATNYTDGRMAMAILQELEPDLNTQPASRPAVGSATLKSVVFFAFVGALLGGLVLAIGSHVPNLAGHVPTVQRADFSWIGGFMMVSAGLGDIWQAILHALGIQVPPAIEFDLPNLAGEGAAARAPPILQLDSPAVTNAIQQFLKLANPIPALQDFKWKLNNPDLAKWIPPPDIWKTGKKFWLKYVVKVPKNPRIMDVTAEYRGPSDIPVNVLNRDGLLIRLQLQADQLAEMYPNQADEIRKELREIRAYAKTKDYERMLAVGRTMAAMIARIRRQEPDRYIVHFARDMALNLAVENTLDTLQSNARPAGGALYLNRDMMGSVYDEMHDHVLPNGEARGDIAASVEEWFEAQMREGDPAFVELAEATRDSLQLMGLFDQDKVLLMDTGYAGTMPWYAHAVIHYYDKAAGRARRNVQISLVQSHNRTPKLTKDNIGRTDRSLLAAHAVAGPMADHNLSMAQILEDTGDLGYHPVRFDETSSLIVPETAANQLRFRFLRLLFVNMAVAQYHEELGVEKAARSGEEIPKLPDYLLKPGLNFHLISLDQLSNLADSTNKLDSYLAKNKFIDNQQWDSYKDILSNLPKDFWTVTPAKIEMPKLELSKFKFEPLNIKPIEPLIIAPPKIGQMTYSVWPLIFSLFMTNPTFALQMAWRALNFGKLLSIIAGGLAAQALIGVPAGIALGSIPVAMASAGVAAIGGLLSVANAFIPRVHANGGRDTVDAFIELMLPADLRDPATASLESYKNFDGYYVVPIPGLANIKKNFYHVRYKYGLKKAVIYMDAEANGNELILEAAERAADDLTQQSQIPPAGGAQLTHPETYADGVAFLARVRRILRRIHPTRLAEKLPAAGSEAERHWIQEWYAPYWSNFEFMHLAMHPVDFARAHPIDTVPADQVRNVVEQQTWGAVKICIYTYLGGLGSWAFITILAQILHPNFSPTTPLYGLLSLLVMVLGARLASGLAHQRHNRRHRDDGAALTLGQQSQTADLDSRAEQATLERKLIGKQFSEYEQENPLYSLRVADQQIMEDAFARVLGYGSFAHLKNVALRRDNSAYLPAADASGTIEFPTYGDIVQQTIQRLPYMPAEKIESAFAQLLGANEKDKEEMDSLGIWRPVGNPLSDESNYVPGVAAPYAKSWFNFPHRDMLYKLTDPTEFGYKSSERFVGVASLRPRETRGATFGVNVWVENKRAYMQRYAISANQLEPIDETPIKVPAFNTMITVTDKEITLRDRAPIMGGKGLNFAVYTKLEDDDVTPVDGATYKLRIAPGSTAETADVYAMYFTPSDLDNAGPLPSLFTPIPVPASTEQAVQLTETIAAPAVLPVAEPGLTAQQLKERDKLFAKIEKSEWEAEASQALRTAFQQVVGGPYYREESSNHLAKFKAWIKNASTPKMADARLADLANRYVKANPNPTSAFLTADNTYFWGLLFLKLLRALGIKEAPRGDDPSDIFDPDFGMKTSEREWIELQFSPWWPGEVFNLTFRPASFAINDHRIDPSVSLEDRQAIEDSRIMGARDSSFSTFREGAKVAGKAIVAGLAALDVAISAGLFYSPDALRTWAHTAGNLSFLAIALAGLGVVSGTVAGYIANARTHSAYQNAVPAQARLTAGGPEGQSQQEFAQHMARFEEILNSQFKSVAKSESAMRTYGNLFLLTPVTAMVSTDDPDALLHSINRAREVKGEPLMRSTTGSFKDIAKVHKAIVHFYAELQDPANPRELDKTTANIILQFYNIRREIERTSQPYLEAAKYGDLSQKIDAGGEVRLRVVTAQGQKDITLDAQNFKLYRFAFDRMMMKGDQIGVLVSYDNGSIGEIKVLYPEQDIVPVDIYEKIDEPEEKTPPTKQPTVVLDDTPPPGKLLVFKQMPPRSKPKKDRGDKNVAEDHVHEMRDTHPKIKQAIEQGNAYAVSNLIKSDLDALFQGSNAEVAQKLVAALTYDSDEQRRQAAENLQAHFTRGPTRAALKASLRAAQKAMQASSQARQFKNFRLVVILANDPFFTNAVLFGHTGQGKKSGAQTVPTIYVYQNTLQIGKNDTDSLQYFLEHEAADFHRGYHKWRNADEERFVTKFQIKVRKSKKSLEKLWQDVHKAKDPLENYIDDGHPLPDMPSAMDIARYWVSHEEDLKALPGIRKIKSLRQFVTECLQWNVPLSPGPWRTVYENAEQLDSAARVTEQPSNGTKGKSSDDIVTAELDASLEASFRDQVAANVDAALKHQPPPPGFDRESLINLLTYYKNPIDRARELGPKGASWATLGMNGILIRTKDASTPPAARHDGNGFKTVLILTVAAVVGLTLAIFVPWSMLSAAIAANDFLLMGIVGGSAIIGLLGVLGFIWFGSKLQNKINPNANPEGVKQYIRLLQSRLDEHRDVMDLFKLNRNGRQMSQELNRADFGLELGTDFAVFYDQLISRYEEYRNPRGRIIHPALIKTALALPGAQAERRAPEIAAVGHPELLAIITLQQEEIAALKARIADLEKDSLTGLPNRKVLNEALDELVRMAEKDPNFTFSTIMIDADKFKDVNDQFGHLVGDQVLKYLAGHLRDSDIVMNGRAGRWGGEEFIVLLPFTNQEGAIAVAEKIREAVETEMPNVIGEQEYIRLAAIAVSDKKIPPGKTLKRGVTVSLGVGTYQSGESVEKLLERTDRALYAAKAGGRNQVAVSEEDHPNRRFSDVWKIVPALVFAALSIFVISGSASADTSTAAHLAKGSIWPSLSFVGLIGGLFIGRSVGLVRARQKREAEMEVAKSAVADGAASVQNAQQKGPNEAYDPTDLAQVADPKVPGLKDQAAATRQELFGASA